MNGIFIPSHRPAYIYRKVESIPTKINARTELLTNYVNELRNRFNIGARSQSPSFRIKEALISLAALGYGNDVVRENREAIDTFEGFQDVLRSILPKTMGFRRIAIELPEVVFETSVGNFSFDAVSGGISAIIDLGWQIYMASLVYTGPFVVIIDEPENHLHPTLQKALLPSLLEAFPKPQFIVATHNPLIISSTTESNIFVLNYRDDEERQEVFSERLDFVNRAGTSNEILRDVLGVEYASPNWVSDKVEALLKELSSGPIDEASLERLRSQLQDLGLAEYFPKALEGLLDKHAPT